jgi:hypothetical protein
MPNLDAPPEVAPVAPLPARDESLIAELTGPRPVAPTIEPTPLIVRLARALQGFGAGVQGQGPQFLAQLEEERQRPQREFRAATERYEQRRGRAVEFAEDKRQRQQADIQRRADEQSEREFRQWAQRTGVQDSMALEQLRQTFETEKEARRLEAERLEQERRDRRQQERDARAIEERYFTATKNRGLSKELGLYWSGLKESLSPAAARLDAQVQGIGEVRMNKAGRIGGGGTGGQNTKAEKARQQFESTKQQVIDAVARGDATGEQQLRKRMTAAFNSLSRFPGVFEQGFDASGQWPYVKYRNGSTPTQPQQQPAQAKTITRAEMQALGVTEAEAKSEGYTITP